MTEKNEPPYFRLQSAALKIGNSPTADLEFVSEDADLEKTHITLILGPNGSSKSRILGGIIDVIRARASQPDTITARNSAEKSGKKIYWRELNTLGNSGPPQLNLDGPLPSRALAISNIVMDKFPYTSGRQESDEFYYYLGSRQASNAVMLGSIGRSMIDALIEMSPTSDLYETFESWIELALGKKCEIAISFPGLSKKDISSFIDSQDRSSFIQERLIRRLGSARRKSFSDEDVQRITASTNNLFDFLSQHGTDELESAATSKHETGAAVKLPVSDKIAFESFRRSLQAVPDISKAGYSARPSVLIKLHEWVDFNDLSSGEQNILSAGAKLVAFSKPGCLIAIDEPEVSLNAAWQQKYVDLVLNSLRHAPGSHVLIATHSPHLVANLPQGQATVVVVSRAEKGLEFQTKKAEFEGWGAEAILYEVFDIPSASSFLLNREIAKVLRHIQDNGTDTDLIDSFIEKISRVRTFDIEPLEEIIEAVKIYREQIS